VLLALLINCFSRCLAEEEQQQIKASKTRTTTPGTTKSQAGEEAIVLQPQFRVFNRPNLANCCILSTKNKMSIP
jgi:hypothetical protein